MKITKNQYENIKNSNQQLFLKFSAEWCGPCKRYAPVYQQFSEINPQLQIFSVDCDDQRELAEHFGIMSIPCTIVVKNGEVQHRKNGILSAEDLQAMID